MWIENPPAACHPLVEQGNDPDTGQPRPPAPDVDSTVTVFPVRADLVDACASWCAGVVLHVNGLPAVLLPAGRDVAGLGDYVVRHDDGRFAREAPGGFDQRYELSVDPQEES